MEVVLVADAASLAVRPDLPLKRVGCEVANISVARNLGIAAASGDVVAFIDDDAVAEPTWAGRLAAPFAVPDVIAAGGFTRGPYGRRWQMRAEAITPDGPRPLPVPDGRRLYRPANGVTLGLLGTNCAFRRGALAAVGGFDPAFAYHLDESDLLLRLAAAFPQAATALIPGAEVTHGTAPSERRGPVRVPRDLTQIGRSEAIFAARHGGDPAAIPGRMRARLAAHVEAGRLDPFAVPPLMASLHRGMAAAGTGEGSTVWPSGAGLPIAPLDPGGFLPLAADRRPRPAHVLAGPFRRRADLRREAARLVADHGAIVTLLLLTPSLLPHRTRFQPGGWWEQSGGLWRPSQPGDPPLIPVSGNARIMRESGFVTAVRNPDRHPAVA